MINHPQINHPQNRCGLGHVTHFCMHNCGHCTQLIAINNAIDGGSPLYGVVCLIDANYAIY